MLIRWLRALRTRAKTLCVFGEYNRCQEQRADLWLSQWEKGQRGWGDCDRSVERKIGQLMWFLKIKNKLLTLRKGRRHALTVLESIQLRGKMENSYSGANLDWRDQFRSSATGQAFIGVLMIDSLNSKLLSFPYVRPWIRVWKWKDVNRYEYLRIKTGNPCW